MGVFDFVTESSGFALALDISDRQLSSSPLGRQKKILDAFPKIILWLA
jgi:hypothetical protein